MTEKIIWIVFTLHLIPNLSECTKLSGMLSDRRMNLNVLKMFDRFFYLRYNDAFFIRNTEKTITDEYLISLYTEEFEMTESLKKDLRMHAIHLENTAWYTTSITELFSILYTKYLAANHIISLANCRIYYTYGDANVERATRCKKIAKYLHAFVEIALGKYITRTEEFLSNVLGVRNKNENRRPYENLFYGFYQYFTHVTSVMVLEENYRPEIPDSKDELLKILLLRETEFEQTTRLTFKYFFRNVFFDTPLKDFVSLLKKAEEEKMVLNSKKFTNIRNETIKFWGIVDNLIKKIEEGDLIATTLIDKETEEESDEDESSEPNKRVAAKSNIAEMIRKLEIRKLAVRGVKLSGLKKETENEVFQFFIEADYKGYEPVGQKLKFVSVEAEKLSNLEIHLKSYTSMGEVLSSQDFSYEVQDIMSSAEVYNSAADKSFNSMSAESYKTVVSTAVSSISKQEMDASRVKYAAEIRRLVAEKSSAAAAGAGGRSSNMNYSKPGDLSHLARYMASSNQANNSRMISGKSMRSSEGGTSDYGDVSQNLSRSSAMRDNSKVYYKNNIPKRNRVTFSSSQAIAA